MQRALTTFVPRCLLYTLKYTSLRSACYSVNKEANIASLASVNDRVKLLWHSGEKDKAFRELEQNSHLFSPENTKEYVEFNSKLAAVHLAQGRTENAEKILNEILSLDIDDSERATAISAVASLVDEAQQIAFLKRRLTLANTDDINRRINADLGATYYNRAVTVTGHGPNATAALKLEALDSAIKHYDLAVNDLHDEDTRISFAKAFMQRGITHHMRIDVDKDMTEKQVLKQIELAREDYTTALALDGSLYYCYFKQGDLSSYLKDSGRAIWEYCEFEKHFEEFCNSDFASSKFYELCITSRHTKRRIVFGVTCQEINHVHLHQGQRYGDKTNERVY
jgi:tetratricopeptide (TPR) repeat protein